MGARLRLTSIPAPEIGMVFLTFPGTFRVCPMPDRAATEEAAVEVAILVPAVAVTIRLTIQPGSSLKLSPICPSAEREEGSRFLAFTQAITQHRRFSVVLAVAGRTTTIFS